ncbi:putative WD40/YVTN repeat-like-containing domain superfamily [Septoria linicola]|nr:putative WD40/YVTN repeat-like-containing domain superfamily [Septoria linicola]
MPVSTFSPDHSSRSRGALISRWTSTRDRIDADEQRLSMQELDGRGLYDRPDWPLSLSSAAEQHRKRGRRHGEVAELEDERVDEGAVLRRLEDISPTLAILNGGAYTTDHDVSDMEEEDEDGDDGESDSLSSSSPPRPTQHQYQPHQLPQSYSRSGRESPQHRHSSHGSQRQPYADVSPVREHHHARSRVVQDTTAEQELELELEQHSRADSDTVQQIHDDEEDEDSDFEESRDAARPLSYSTSSPALQQGTTPTSSPYLNGTAFSALTNNDRSNHRTSIAKDSMHSHLDRRLSRRSSIYNTTQIPYQKERVRYSWQSIQDDEPNRPRIHVIKLFSQTVTASAGFPTGEAFGFSISAGGRRIAAYNSARLYVLQTNALPVGISQDYVLKRRPVDVDLTDEGDTLAILADDHTINVYELGHELRRTKTITLDFPTHHIALAQTGGLLAAAYEGGIEVFSLHPNALPADRRAVRSAKVDRIMFSEDGSTLLGTTTRINVSSTVTVSVPMFPARADGVPTHEELKEAWCSELLHPENIRNSSHATFMRENRKTCNEKVFAWNGLEDTFGILNLSDMHYGNSDFPVVISPPLSTCGGLGAAIHSCPSIDEHGNTVAMIVNDRTIRLYIVPTETGDELAPLEAHSIDHELDEGYGCPFSEARWVHSSASLPAPHGSMQQVRGRLIVTSPGGVTELGMSEESVDDVEGGRIILFDFDPQFAGQPGQTFSLTLGKSPPAPLDEEKKSINEQVNLVRRRTVNQSKSSALNQRPTTLGRSATTHGNRSMRAAGPAIHGPVGRSNRTSMLSIGSFQSDAARSLPDLLENGEAADEVFEEPYVQGQPRSHASLQRAASNAQRHRFQTLEERNQAHVTADSSGGFLTLPEYTEEPNAPLPSRFRAMAGLDAPSAFNRARPTVITTVNGDTASLSVPGATTHQAPHTAPPDVGETFSADGAFQTANDNLELSPELRLTDSAQERREIRRIEIEQQGMGGTSPQSPTPSTRSSIPSSLARLDSRQQARLDHLPRGAGTYSSASTYDSRSYSPVPVSAVSAYGSFAAMPRSLQRAYSNAVSPLVPGTTGDRHNVSPVNISATSTTGHLEDEDIISPVGSQQNVPFARGPAGSNSFRHSTSLLNPPGHAVHRTQPSGATVATMPETPSAPLPSMPARRMPPHMQAFRNAAAANASASLFPPSQDRDHVPIRQPTIRAGTAGHPITAWHPPAPSTPLPQSSHGTIRGNGHTRRTSSGKLGFFRKKDKKADPYAPDEMQWQDGEVKSVMTWGNRRGERCSVM